MLGGMTDQAPAPLTPVTEDWQRALCVVAHPDDLEFGGAAAVARWTAQGKDVVYCMVTSGEAGIDGMHPDEAREVREAEQVASARIVGVPPSTLATGSRDMCGGLPIDQKSRASRSRYRAA